MKKIFVVFALMAMLMLPFTSFSMTAMEEGDLSSVTGQSGVSINLDVTLDLAADVLAWGDNDGDAANGFTQGGWVGIKDLDAQGIRIRLRKDISDNIDGIKELATTQAINYQLTTGGWGVTLASAIGTGTNAAIIATALGAPVTEAYVLAHPETCLSPAAVAALTYAAFTNHLDVSGGIADVNAATLLGTISAFSATVPAVVPTMPAYADLGPVLQLLRPLTIDVATGAKEGVGGVTYVHIGLGTIEIAINRLGGTVGLSPYTETSGVADAPLLTQELGSFYIGDLTLRLGAGYENSWIDIYRIPGATQGVALGMYVNIDTLTIGSLSWGDSDGAPTVAPGEKYNQAKTAGYVGLADLSIDGLIVDGAVHINVGTTTGATPTTYVQIGFASLKVSIGNLDADVFVNSAPTADETGTVSEAGNTLNKLLGHLYMGGLSDMTIGGSVAISAPAGSTGVVIDLNAQVNALTLEALSWGDEDGVTYTMATPIAADPLAVPPVVADPDHTTTVADTAAGYVGLKNVTIGGAAGLTLGGQLTINIATDNTDGHGFAGATFVSIGFNALSVSLDEMSGTVALSSEKTLSDTMAQELGSFYVGNISDVVIEGKIDIAAEAATGQGVAIWLGLEPSDLTIGVVSWGDSDGFTDTVLGLTATDEGYVGLLGLAITDLAVSGLVTIDVATINPGATDNYAFYSIAGMSTTFVHIGLGSGTAGDPDNTPTISTITDATATGFTAGTLGIRIAGLGATVALGNTPALLTSGTGVAFGTLGLLNVQDLRVGINGWVDIAAH